MKLPLFYQIPLILGMVLTDGLCTLNASDLYYANGNSVYRAEAKEINFEALGQVVPIALTLNQEMNLTGQPEKSIVVFSPLKNTIVRVALSTYFPPSLLRKFKPESLIIDQGKLYFATGAPQKIVDHSTDSSKGIMSITSRSNHGRLCMLSIPKDSFPGSVCVVADAKTGRDFVSFRLKDIYANTVDTMTWVSPKDVICMMYSRRGNSCFLIDTENKTSSWTGVGDAQYISTVGGKIILYFEGKGGSVIPKELKL